MKKYLFGILSIFMLTISLLGMYTKHNYTQADNNPATWILCGKKTGNFIYNSARTDLLPYHIRSKSALTDVSSTDNLFNTILNSTGYKVGVEADSSKILNPFDRFGFSGLHYGSYAGEWKYFEFDACVEDEEQSYLTDFGKYYIDRKEPKASYEETTTSKDPRSLQFNKGVSATWSSSLGDGISNIFLFFSKLMMTITLALLSLSFTDVSESIGLTGEASSNMLKFLFTSVYEPLIVLAIVGTSIYMIWFGIIKRQYRQTLVNGVLKLLLSLVLAYLVFAYPEKSLSFPNKVVNTIQGIVVSAFSTSTQDNQEVSLCSSDVGNLFDNTGVSEDKYFESIAENVKSELACKIWEEFLFKPWTENQFGSKFEDLNNLPNINKDWVKEPEVNLGTNKTYTNWALFNLSTQTDKHVTLGNTPIPPVNGVNADWWRIVDALSNYDDKEERKALPGVKQIHTDETYNAIKQSGGGKGNLNGDQTKFLEEFGEVAKKVGDESGLYASVIMAQGILESGWGKSMSGDYNYFGIKCGGNYTCKTLDTNEVINGNTVSIKDAFRNFSSMEDGIAGYARFIYGEGTRVDYTGSTKLKANTAEEAAQAIAAAGYATAPDYAKKIIEIIQMYDLTKYDTDKKEPSNPEKYKPQGVADPNNNSSTKSNNTVNNTRQDNLPDSILVVEQIPSEPLEQWQHWIGNKQATRMGGAIINVAFVIIGSLPMLFFAFAASIYSVGITLMVIISPLFFLFSMWAGKGQQVFNAGLGLFLSTIMRKIVATMLLVVSIAFVTTSMNLINTIGWFKALIFLCVISYALIKNKDKLLTKLGTINIGGVNLMNKVSEKYRNYKNKAKGVAGSMSTATVAGIAGSKAAKEMGGTGKEGFATGFTNSIKNDLYKSHMGRSIMHSYSETTRNNQKQAIAHKNCVMCGIEIYDDTLSYVDDMGNNYCLTCGDENVNDIELYEVYPNNDKDIKYKSSTGMTSSDLNNQINFIKNKTSTGKAVVYFDIKELDKVRKENISKLKIDLSNYVNLDKIEIPQFLNNARYINNIVILNELETNKRGELTQESIGKIIQEWEKGWDTFYIDMQEILEQEE